MCPASWGVCRANKLLCHNNAHVSITFTGFILSHNTEQIILVNALSDIAPDQWNALAGDHPAARHEYLNGLEITACVGPGTGWDPNHILLYRHGELVGAMPLYLKSHSRGEYVFDYAWAHAFERHGVPYYPKLLSAIPFTPVPGPRLLARTSADKNKLVQAAIAIAQRNQISSLHVLFPLQDDLTVLEANGLMSRSTVQFHWTNKAYGTMDDFLASMNQKNRKKTRQSRRKLENEGIGFEWLEGPNIDDESLDFFYRCYYRTYIEHGNLPYLNLEFFAHLRDTLPDGLVLILALRNGQPVASALNLRSKSRLFGRYWGSMETISGLHFETCYLQGIEYCIHRGLDTFEGGAQGEHKLARGLLPVQTHSAHWIRDPAYAQAIEDFLEREDTMIADYVEVLEGHSPFRRVPPEIPG